MVLSILKGLANMKLPGFARSMSRNYLIYETYFSQVPEFLVPVYAVANYKLIRYGKTEVIDGHRKVMA